MSEERTSFQLIIASEVTCIFLNAYKVIACLSTISIATMTILSIPVTVSIKFLKCSSIHE